MKNEIRLALLCLATASVSVPAFAQNALPRCGSANFDQTQNAFTIKNAPSGTVNQQCLITVYPAGAMPAQAQQDSASYFAEGTYAIELVGGGGGGGGGGAKSKGGGGGGAGAAPSKSVKYLAPGDYKMTIGTGGFGGSARGGRTGAGNPTSLTNANTGQLIAGFPGADTWTQQTQASGSGRGGAAAAGGSRGGSGGDSGPRSEERAQAGGYSRTPGYAGVPGQAGSETGRSVKREDGSRVVQADAGGGGGASIGSGATGDSATRSRRADPGTAGGPGLIRLTMTEAAPQAIAAVPAPAPAAAPAAEVVTTPAPVAARPARKDRN